jgi:hypothetical protein
VRLNPAFQKAGRYRNARGIGLYAFELHARKPTAVDSFANLGTKTPFNTRPAFIGNLGHFNFSQEYRRPIGRDDSLIGGGSASPQAQRDAAG